MASSADTRTRLLNETVRAIERNGFQNISMRDIASAAGLTTGSSYRQFGSKENLLIEAGYLVSEDFANRIFVESARHEDAFDELLHVGTSLLSLACTNPNLIDFLFYGPLYKQATKTSSQSKSPSMLDEMSRITVQAAEQYQHVKDPNFLFTQLWALIQGYSLLVSHNIVAYDEECISCTLRELLGEPRS
jgi:AcrR family transcriptional regulator